MELRALLGKTIHAVIDRPMGYVHKGMVYPVNYGYIPGTTAGDGEEQDVYILGVDKPVTEFYGTVIGIIRRHNDNEDKLVAAPQGMRFHQAQIAQAVHFQEQYFDYTIESTFRKSCGVIPYRKVDDQTQFLLLHQSFSGNWSFPKGHMEPGETEEQTALRELKEETGLTTQLIPGQRATLEYPISSYASKEVVVFLGAVNEEPEIDRREIDAYCWFTSQEFPHYLLPETISACKTLIESV